ncbi:methionine ABC transporter ATP-binding protein [Bacillus sp. NPDC077027]|uniref:methionine ABC transporter ATP-binding protein n=1 Tax=Bacillus sp. NPDC077027 TaxID=3390548 RepID=UPI003CFDF9DF
MIHLQNVSKTYHSKNGDVDAVKDVNLSIDKGEIFGIIGYSGAGKSSLIRLLNGLELPTEGTVEVAGNKINDISSSKLRKARQEISMIFQHFNLLWSRTVRQNIMFPLEIAGVPTSKRIARANELIKLVGLEGKENVYPSQLSGGQKQRVGIARALANDPKVLLCDEATSALDPQTTDSILELLADINKRLGLTIVLITHEMHVIRKICHRVAVMENGRIVEEGEVLRVFRQPKEEMTKLFVKQLADPEEAQETIEHVLERVKEGKVVRLSFIGDSAEQPLITEIIREFQVDVNILQGKISQTQEGAFGTLFIHINGEEAEVQKVIAHIQSKQVEIEVMTNV